MPIFCLYGVLYDVPQATALNVRDKHLRSSKCRIGIAISKGKVDRLLSPNVRTESQTNPNLRDGDSHLGMQWIAGFKVPCAVTDSVPRVEKALWILDLEMALRV